MRERERERDRERERERERCLCGSKASTEELRLSLGNIFSFISAVMVQ